MLIVQIDENGHVARDPVMTRKDKKNQKGLATTLLELMLINLVWMTMKNLVEEVLTLLNQLKSKLKIIN